jgi:hypothetical protein
MLSPLLIFSNAYKYLGKGKIWVVVRDRRDKVHLVATILIEFNKNLSLEKRFIRIISERIRRYSFNR